jgi:hypothetical protein
MVPVANRRHFAAIFLEMFCASNPPVFFTLDSIVRKRGTISAQDRENDRCLEAFRVVAGFIRSGEFRDLCRAWLLVLGGADRKTVLEVIRWLKDDLLRAIQAFENSDSVRSFGATDHLVGFHSSLHHTEHHCPS